MDMETQAARNKRMDSFLAELSLLSAKHGIALLKDADSDKTFVGFFNGQMK